MSEKSLGSFFSKHSEEEQKALQESVDRASSEGKAPIQKLKASGTFLMEVPTFAYKDDKGRMKKMPTYKESETKGSLMLVLPLVVADEPKGVPKGSSTITNIVLCPAPGASKKKRDAVMDMMKSKIIALTGEENISMTAEWFDEWLFPKYEEKDGRFELIKDHKMKNKVMVVTELEEYQGKIKPSVKSIDKAKDGDHSVPDEILVEEASKQDIKDPVDSEIEYDIDKIADKAVDGGSDTTTETADSGSSAAATPIDDTSSLPDDF